MLSSKQSLSHFMKRIPNPLSTKDCTVTLIRNISRTSVLERKINTRKPRAWSYEKQLILDICKPKYPPNASFNLPVEQRCQKSVSRLWLLEKRGLNEENPYEKILAKEILELFETSKMVAIVHTHSMLAETKFEVHVAYKRLGMQVRDYYGRHTIEMAVRDTKYASILPLFKISETLIFSPEVKVDALLSTMKKTPQLTLMATIVDGQLLSKTETEFYASTNLATQQALLVQTINSAATSLTTSLNQHAQTLVGYLDQHAGSAGSSGGSSDNAEGISQAAASETGSAGSSSESGSADSSSVEAGSADSNGSSESGSADNSSSSEAGSGDISSSEAESVESSSVEAGSAESSGSSEAGSAESSSSEAESVESSSSEAESVESSSSKAGSADSNSTSEADDKSKSS
ncbi:hypothetical protein WDU94_008641 [Cyamophila willieti]